MEGIKEGMTKSEIETFLKDKGDFIQVDYLNRYLKTSVAMHSDTKRFVYMKLGEAYERRGMFSDAANAYGNGAISAIQTPEKIKCHAKEAECFAKANLFDSADRAMRKAFTLATPTQVAEIYITIKNIYKKIAEDSEKSQKYNNAIKLYERILQLKISDDERREIKQKLEPIYRRVGK